MDERAARGGGGFAPRLDGDGERERSRAAVRRGRVRARVPEEWGGRAPRSAPVQTRPDSDWLISSMWEGMTFRESF